MPSGGRTGAVRALLRRQASHALEHFVAQLRELLPQRDDESHADRLFLSLDRARRVPFAEAEPRAVSDEATPDAAAVAERGLEPPEGRADEVQLFL